MQETAFHIANQDASVAILGGTLSQAPDPDTSGTVSLHEKEMIFCLRPEDELTNSFHAFRKLVQGISPWLSLRLFAITLLTPIVLILPAIILIVFIGTVGAYGNLINELISLDGEEMTNLGITKYQLFFIQTSLYIIGAYAFPLFFQGDYDDTISRFKQLTDNQEIMKSRFRSAFKLLHKRGYLHRINIWNPNLISDTNNWLPETLLPAIAQSKVPVRMMVKIEEQFVCKKILEELYDKKYDAKLQWHEEALPDSEQQTTPIHLSYLENWEREMWQIFSAASTQNLPDFWQKEAKTSTEGALPGVISIPLARKIVGHFGNRLFSESLSEYESSVSLFASRCINDYALMRAFDEREQHMFQADSADLAQELIHLKEERSYILPYLQRQAAELAAQQQDIAALVILGGSQAEASIYHASKRKVIEAFIQTAAHRERFKVLRYYWDHMVGEIDQDQQEAEVELFRMLQTAVLQELVLAFRRAGMYEKTALCYRFLRAIYPVESRIGEAIVLSEQGKYHASVEHFLATEAEWMGDLSETKKLRTSTDVHSRLSLHLFMCVVVVMNRLEKYKNLAEQSLALIGEFLLQMGDGERDNHQLTRYYNVLASYHEWLGDYAQAIDTYEKGLSIPGVDRSLISSLMVNKGIAYRMLAKEKTATEEAQSLFRKAIHDNREGAEAKEIIGNVDQLPIALHNLAESYLELAHRLDDIEERSRMLQAAQNQAQRGLQINQDIKSSKKKGQLLVERFLADKGLAEIQNQPPSPLFTKSLLDWIHERQDTAGYDVEVVLDLLRRLGQWKGKNMTEAAQWLRNIIDPTTS